MMLDTTKLVPKVLFVCTLLVHEGNVAMASCASGFPVKWTTATPGVTYWHSSEKDKYQFTSTNIALYENGIEVVRYDGCSEEFYNVTTRIHYYLLSVTGSDMATCFMFREHNDVLQMIDHNSITTSQKCFSKQFEDTNYFMALTKYNPSYVNCPFEFGQYNFTFSNSSEVLNYCAGQKSTADINGQTITLDTCLDASLVSRSFPFNGVLSCLAGIPGDDVMGDYLVLEMNDGAKWPYCAKYKVNHTSGVITMSIHLPAAPYVPTYCYDAPYDLIAVKHGSNLERLVFTPYLKVSDIEKDSDSDFHWGWWIMIGVAISVVVVLILVIVYVLCFACKDKNETNTKVGPT